MPRSKSGLKVVSFLAALAGCHVTFGMHPHPTIVMLSAFSYEVFRAEL
jgi:hypothetical protein